MEACQLLAIERALDQIEGELARELAGHMRGFARAYAAGAPPPPAPSALARHATLAAARAALAHPVLADRGLALLRLAAVVAIEADREVATARARPPSWDALAALARARDAAATALLGGRDVDVLHRLSGCTAAAELEAPVLPPPVTAWFEPDGVTLDEPAIARAWAALCVRHGVTGKIDWLTSAAARPRTFVVVPGSEVAVVIPSLIATPAARFAVLHELGHALAALALGPGIPRVLDEAVAAHAARAIERAEHAWYSAAARPARDRRSALARILDRIERTLPRVDDDRPAERPPWALWHDPGAQAAYVEAEPLADEIERGVGRDPAPGALVATLAGLRDRIDRASPRL